MTTSASYDPCRCFTAIRTVEGDTVMGKAVIQRDNYRGDGENFTAIPWKR